MNYRKTEYARLEEILDTDCSRLSTEELKKMLDDELDKPAEMINTELIHVLLDILEPASPTQDQIDQGFAELVDMIESYIRYYNNRRVQRNLGVLTPMEKHNMFLAA